MRPPGRAKLSESKVIEAGMVRAHPAKRSGDGHLRVRSTRRGVNARQEGKTGGSLPALTTTLAGGSEAVTVVPNKSAPQEAGFALGGERQA